MVSGKAQFYLGLMMSAPGHPLRRAPRRPLDRRRPSRAACRRLGSAELGQPWARSVRSTVPYGNGTTTPAYTSGVAPGSFGPIPMSGRLLRRADRAAAGAGPAAATRPNLHFCFIEMTATVERHHAAHHRRTADAATYANEGSRSSERASSPARSSARGEEDVDHEDARPVRPRSFAAVSAAVALMRGRRRRARAADRHQPSAAERPAAHRQLRARWSG